MSAVSELEVPQWDYADQTITGQRFHEVMQELREQSWIARADPVGWIVLDHEAVAFFMRTSQANFPGILMLEVQGITEGPMWDRMKGTSSTCAAKSPAPAQARAARLLAKGGGPVQCRPARLQ